MRYVIHERFFRLGEDSDITDESGRTVYHVDGKVMSLRGKLSVEDDQGNEVAQVQRKLIAFRPTYEISISGRETVQVKKHLFTPFRDRYSVDLPGPDDLEVVGKIFDHEFEVRRGDDVIATVSKHWLTVTDTYGIDVSPGEDDLLVLTTVLALDMAEDSEGATNV